MERVTRGYKALQGFKGLTKGNKGIQYVPLQGITGGYKRLNGVTRGYWGWQAVSKGFGQKFEISSTLIFIQNRPRKRI